MAVVTTSDCPQSVRFRCVIECSDGVFVLSHCFLDFSVGVRAFVIGLSQISSFFQKNKIGEKLLVTHHFQSAVVLIEVGKCRKKIVQIYLWNV